MGRGCDGDKNIDDHVKSSLVCLFHSQHFVDGRDDVVGLWQSGDLEGLGVGHGGIDSSHAPHWSVEVEERFVFHDAGADLRSDAWREKSDYQ